MPCTTRIRIHAHVCISMANAAYKYTALSFSEAFNILHIYANSYNAPRTRQSSKFIVRYFFSCVCCCSFQTERRKEPVDTSSQSILLVCVCVSFVRNLREKMKSNTCCRRSQIRCRNFFNKFLMRIKMA